MKYTQKSFNSSPSTQAYRDNFDRIFRRSKIDSGFPDVPDGLEQRIKEFHKRGDRCWEDGDKSASDGCHHEAYALGEPYGLNPVKCGQCGVYVPKRGLAEHKEKCLPGSQTST
jgi:hypothetical protein